MYAERGAVQADEVVIAANGYTRDIRRVVPLGSHIIATEELPPNLAASLIPKRRTFGRYRPRAVLLLDVPGRYANDLRWPRTVHPVTPQRSAPIRDRFMTDRPQLHIGSTDRHPIAELIFGLTNTHRGKRNKS